MTVLHSTAKLIIALHITAALQTTCDSKYGIHVSCQSDHNLAQPKLAPIYWRKMHGLVTTVLRQLYWLPVRQRVMLKMAALVHRSLTGTAPDYLSDECHLTSSVGVRSLHSADSRTCLPRRTHNGYGVRCFAAASPSLWNSLLLQCSFENRTFNLTVLKL